jgi:hypothetical protein
MSVQRENGRRRNWFTYRTTTLLAAIAICACLLSLAQDDPNEVCEHGTFEVSSPGEIIVYEFFDDSVSGEPAMVGQWNVKGHWINSGSDHWICHRLVVQNASVAEDDLRWEKEPRYCSVSGSMTSVFDPAFTREKSAYPLRVPWTDKPFTDGMGSIGEHDEFWQMKHSLIMTDYGVILQAGNGDDGAYKYFVGRNSNGKIGGIRCLLEDDTSYWLDRYYSQPLFRRLWKNIAGRFE